MTKIEAQKRIGQPVPDSRVPGGYLSDTTVLTDSDGVALTTYYSGSDATEVKITATAKQS